MIRAALIATIAGIAIAGASAPGPIDGSCPNLPGAAISFCRNINVMHWGAKCDGHTDDAAAIQGANDYAYEHGALEINFPATGACCSYTPPLYMDAPGNLRANLQAPTIFGFSLRWVGAGLAGNINHGSWLCPNSEAAPALWIGTGAGMTISGLNIRGPNTNPFCDAERNPSGIGIAIAGGPGGSTQTLIENVHVVNFYTGIKTGANVDSLSDSVTLHKTWIEGAYYGFYVGATQNFILDLDQTTITAAKAVYVPQNIHVNVRGGSQGGPGAPLLVAPVSGISTLSGKGSGPYTFTAALTLAHPLCYHRAAFKTAHFGVVPALLTGYANGVGSFQLLPAWVVSQFGAQDLVAGTDLQAELQATTQVFLGGDQTIWTGAINASGVHIETPCPYTMLDMQTAQPAGNQQQSVIERIRYNGDPAGCSLQGSLGSGSTNEAAFLLQQSHPWMSLSNYSISARDSNFGSAGADHVLIDAWHQGAGYSFSGNVYLGAPNWRSWSDVHNPGLDGLNARFKGLGTFDASPYSRSSGLDSQYPAVGYRPAPWAIPRLSASQFTALGSLPALGTYDPIHGDTLYQVLSYDPAAGAKFVRSGHHFASWGQNLSVNWTYKGGSNVALVDSTANLFAGLYIGLSIGGTTQWMVVTGVYPSLGYVTVTSVGDGITVPLNPGDKLTVYTGSVILQEPYSFSTMTLQ